MWSKWTSQKLKQSQKKVSVIVCRLSTLLCSINMQHNERYFGLCFKYILWSMCLKAVFRCYSHCIKWHHLVQQCCLHIRWKILCNWKLWDFVRSSFINYILTSLKTPVLMKFCMLFCRFLCKFHMTSVSPGYLN
jgi:hypothetical protein